MQWVRWKRGGQTANADTIWRLARQPRFRWFGRFTRPRMQKKVRGFLDRVQCDQPGTVPQMVVMRHQGKGCSGTYRAGGAAEDRRTCGGTTTSPAVGDARVVIGFEPDSLGTIDCLARDRRDDRLRLLRYGVTCSRSCRTPRSTSRRAPPTGSRPRAPPSSCATSASQGARLHAERDPPRLDAQEHPARPRDLAASWAASRSSSTRPTTGAARCTTGGGSTQAGTSGAGSTSGATRACAASGRRRPRRPRIRRWTPTCTSTAPATRPDRATAARCRWAPGGPSAGLMYAKYATDWESPPPGTRYGHFKRYSLRALGAFA